MAKATAVFTMPTTRLQHMLDDHASRTQSRIRVIVVDACPNGMLSSVTGSVHAVMQTIALLADQGEDSLYRFDSQ